MFFYLSKLCIRLDYALLLDKIIKLYDYKKPFERFLNPDFHVKNVSLEIVKIMKVFMFIENVVY